MPTAPPGRVLLSLSFLQYLLHILQRLEELQQRNAHSEQRTHGNVLSISVPIAGRRYISIPIAEMRPHRRAECRRIVMTMTVLG